MRKLWAEFKAIAIGGTVLDLALGFIIGSAFATLVQSFVTNLFLQVVASVVGEPDFQKLQVTLHGTPIRYGVFLNDLLQFMLLAVALFVIIKFMTWIGVERGRPLDQRQCPFCFDRVPGAALICRSCGQQLVAELPTLAEAEHLLDEREARRWPTLPTLPALPPIAIPRRRHPSADPAPGRDGPGNDGPPAADPDAGRDEPPVVSTGGGRDEAPAGTANASGDGPPAGRSAASGTPEPGPEPPRRPAG
jgi:large conductance mechanosensitive channel protein